MKSSLCATIFFLSACILFSCTPAKQTSLPSRMVSVYATSAAQPWLADLYACAGSLSVALKIDANEPDIYLRLGEPDQIISPAYKIGEEEILVVVNNASPIRSLFLNEAREIFTRENSSARAWVFAAGEDISAMFDQLALRGIRVAASTRVAASVEQMSRALESESNAVGILPKRALTDNLREVFSAGVVPVLALTKQGPQGAVSALINCLQK